MLETHPNPDLIVRRDNKPRWNLPETRRHGYQNLARLTRYAQTWRSDVVLTLECDIDPGIGMDSDVEAMIESRHFSAMCVAKGQRVLFDAYAPDFAEDQQHTIMSITKITINLVVGELVAAGALDLAKPVKHYLPEIGSGYAEASVQDVLNMNIENEYTEDYSDPFATSFAHEVAIGWRLPTETSPQQTQKEFLAGLRSEDIVNRTGAANYKSANTDVAGWVCEEVSGKPLALWIRDVAEAIGVEHAWVQHTDREGFPIVDGGGCLSARDLARLGLHFARGGEGVAGRRLGDADFIEQTRKQPGPAMPSPKDWYSYSNSTMTDGTWIGHGGYGGQYMLANPDTGVAISFFSVLENKDAMNDAYSVRLVRMMERLARDL
ncbi:MAG: serine hydrolase domain-containing protein [Pseudomonadota bacterium]